MLASISKSFSDDSLQSVCVLRQRLIVICSCCFLVCVTTQQCSDNDWTQVVNKDYIIYLKYPMWILDINCLLGYDCTLKSLLYFSRKKKHRVKIWLKILNIFLVWCRFSTIILAARPQTYGWDRCTGFREQFILLHLTWHLG